MPSTPCCGSRIDFENNLRAEIWGIHIGEKLGIDTEHVESVVGQVLAESRRRLGGDTGEALAAATVAPAADAEPSAPDDESPGTDGGRA